MVDTEVPPIDLLDMIDDGECRFAPDNVTHDPSPGFYGTAEANSIVRFYVDINGDGNLQIGTDYYLGLTVAEPLDGNNQFPEGYFEFSTPIELNDEILLALGLTYDGLRTIFATAEDLAGNVTPEDQAVDLRHLPRHARPADHQRLRDERSGLRPVRSEAVRRTVLRRWSTA